MKVKFDMSSVEDTFRSYKVGEIVKAKVVLDMQDMLIVNIGGKKDGYILKNELESETIKGVAVGDSFDAIILNTNGENSMVELSRAKAEALIRGNTIASALNVGEISKVVITDANANGLISKLGEYRVFIPFSQISNRKVDKNLKNYINKQLTAVVLEINHDEKKIIMSSRAFEEKEQINLENAFWQATFENKVVVGKVVRFTDFGAFVNVSGVDCLVHNSEISFDRNVKAEDILQLDKSYNFKVIKLDRENKKVSLSYKALQENPLKAKLQLLNVGDIVKGTVVKILPFGALLDIGNGVEGLLHVSEASQTFIKNIYEVAKVGQELEIKIIKIDMENLKVSLSLKAMQEDPEVEKLIEQINNQD